MNTKSISTKVTEENRIPFTLKFLNGFLNLTPKELEVVSNFLSINKEFPCGPKDRKEVCKKMELKNVQTLNNLIRSITTKGVFIYTQNGYKYSSLVRNLDKLNKIEIHIGNV
jgi:hypothetical protein